MWHAARVAAFRQRPALSAPLATFLFSSPQFLPSSQLVFPVRVSSCSHSTSPRFKTSKRKTSSPTSPAATQVLALIQKSDLTKALACLQSIPPSALDREDRRACHKRIITSATLRHSIPTPEAPFVLSEYVAAEQALLNHPHMEMSLRGRMLDIMDALGKGLHIQGTLLIFQCLCKGAGFKSSTQTYFNNSSILPSPELLNMCNFLPRRTIDAKDCSIALTACARAAKLDLANLVVDDMVKAKVQANAALTEALVHCLSHSRSLSPESIRVFLCRTHARIPLDISQCTLLLLREDWAEKRFDNAWQTFQFFFEHSHAQSAVLLTGVDQAWQLTVRMLGTVCSAAPALPKQALLTGAIAWLTSDSIVSLDMRLEVCCRLLHRVAFLGDTASSFFLSQSLLPFAVSTQLHTPLSLSQPRYSTLVPSQLPTPQLAQAAQKWVWEQVFWACANASNLDSALNAVRTMQQQGTEHLMTSDMCESVLVCCAAVGAVDAGLHWLRRMMRVCDVGWRAIVVLLEMLRKHKRFAEAQNLAHSTPNALQQPAVLNCLLLAAIHTNNPLSALVYFNKCADLALNTTTTTTTNNNNNNNKMSARDVLASQAEGLVSLFVAQADLSSALDITKRLSVLQLPISPAACAHLALACARGGLLEDALSVFDMLEEHIRQDNSNKAVVTLASGVLTTVVDVCQASGKSDLVDLVRQRARDLNISLEASLAS